MLLTIYRDEQISISTLVDGFTRVTVLRDGERRLQIDTRSQHIEFVRG